VAELLQEVKAELPDFDLESIGFSEIEADDLINASFYVEEDEKPEHVSDAKNHEVKDLDVTKFDKYIINYSGGKDSTLVAMWAMEHLPKEKLILAYWDSGWQFPEDNAYVEYFAEKYQIETYMFGDPDASRLQADIIKRGYPFYGNLWCQTEYKIAAIKKFQKWIKQKYGENLLTLNGIRKEESAKRADYPEYSRQQGMYIWAPMRDWTNADLLEYFNSHDEKLLPLYKHANRTGCAFCPNMGKVIRQYLQTYHQDVLFEINRTIAQTGKSEFYIRRPDMMIQAFTFFNKPVQLSEKEATEALEFADAAFSEEEFQTAFKPYKGKLSTLTDLRGKL
jgi:3'-phosphoadenosine 5'-phosphosulfate sulfotransferase (PAPS reductase)/FAD synthetase